MISGRGAGLVFALCVAPVAAEAGAWPMAKGETQVIAKVETMRADEGLDPDGVRLPLPQTRVDREASLFIEHGLTDRLTLQMKGAWQQGEDAFVDYEGRGPVELGLRWQAWRNETAVVSVYGGHVFAGEGRNAGYAAPGAGDGDWEMRVLVGASGRAPRWLGARPGFVELQTARVLRADLEDETRIDATVGLDFGANWQVMSQAFAGQVDDNGAAWVHLETSIVRRFGDWRIQVGWRETVAGREIPLASGPVVAIWRRY